MSCHCGNCEDHRVDSYTVSPEGGIPNDSPPVGGSSVQAPASLLKQRHVNLIARVQGNNTFLQVWEGEKHIKEFKTGIGANEMAFFFEDMVIPFRDMFEGLGFSVTEEVYIGE